MQPEARKPLVAIAREHHCLAGRRSCSTCLRSFATTATSRAPTANSASTWSASTHQQLRKSIRGLRREGFRHVTCWNPLEAIDAVTIERKPLWNEPPDDHGPFDIIGDIHGCFDELVELLGELGYQVDARRPVATLPPQGRKAIFLGDLVDRGPGIADGARSS